MEFLKLNCLLSVLLFYTYPGRTSAQCEDPAQLYIIRSVAAGHVLDAQNSPTVEIQYFTGSTEQLWHFERSHKVGAFYVISEHTGEVLDVRNTYIELAPLDESSDLQLWYINHDGTIGNGNYTDWNMDIFENNHNVGTPLLIYENTGLSQQIFTLQEKF